MEFLGTSHRRSRNIVKNWEEKSIHIANKIFPFTDKYFIILKEIFNKNDKGLMSFNKLNI